MCTLGYAHYEDQNYQAAEEYFERALEIARAAGNDLDVAHAMIGQGTVFRATKKYSQAVVAYRESKKSMQGLAPKSRAPMQFGGWDTPIGP